MMLEKVSDLSVEFLIFHALYTAQVNSGNEDCFVNNVQIAAHLLAGELDEKDWDYKIVKEIKQELEENSISNVSDDLVNKKLIKHIIMKMKASNMTKIKEVKGVIVK